MSFILKQITMVMSPQRVLRKIELKTFHVIANNKNNDNNVSSPAGNRTPVSRVTGGDTYHYTTEDESLWQTELVVIAID